MPRKPTYTKLPIYSVCTFRNCIYFSGGGGGKTGIPNQILIYQGKVTEQPAKRIDTGRNIIQNMTTNGSDQILICSANHNIIIFSIEEKGLSLKQLMQFQGDFSFKNPTINSIFIHPQHNIFMIGGDDKIVRFYSFNRKDLITNKQWEHDEHNNAIRSLDGAGSSFYLSTDIQKIVISDLRTKQIVRKIYSDALNPSGSFLQSAYFNLISYKQNEKNPPPVLMCHYLPRSSAFVTKEFSNKMFETLKISSDQSCLSANNRRYIGIACGNGTTYIIDIEKFKCISEQKGHSFVITAATMTKGMKFITGTPQCSYFIQQPSSSHWNNFAAVFCVWIFIATIYFRNSLSAINSGQL